MVFKRGEDQKKTPDEMPKDPIGIVELGKDSIIKELRVKNYYAPEKREVG